MGNAIHGTKMENLRTRIDVKLVNNETRLFKMYIKTKLYDRQNI